ncbi:NlpC/P60 family N-terminal domain-containing protein [Paraburkholderia madseniana]|uniref:SH3 domain-containing protein n=1 Tax=Paraburkholderia madseniana TaxID=2599607 RepID=A0AAP5ENI7_9BURK|nr:MULTISPECIES: SH3 domain-containing C40 family peptidase [Paraburkholderia]MCX4145701.1 SH3 domain-containing protein [Paraburkholderia madseniana]MDN7148649.1 SH3 domain-containing protein [Paraburkholderia sp. WS6]MDQ6407529.1 SH3 domain-containing protein [Paraburkholderia madseniana]
MPVAVLPRFAARLVTRVAAQLPHARRAATLCAALAAAATFTACSNPSPTRDAHARVDTVALFPIANYDQNVDHWLEPDSPGYDRPFLNPADQQAHFSALYARYFGTGTTAPSPWNSAYVAMRVYRQQGADIVALQQRRIDKFDNTGKSGAALGYGENFRPHDKAWIDAIAQNMEVGQFTQEPVYKPERRAIATSNLMVRELPTTDPSFYDHHLAGEGYPFDNLQISAARPGTPLYVLGSSVDGAWRYVQTPDVQGWVRTEGVGLTDDTFVDTWRAATAKSLGAVIVASAPVRDSRGVFRFDAPAGTLLPLAPDHATQPAPHANQPASEAADAPAARKLLVPVRDVDGHAVIRTAQLSDAQIAPMPLAATPRHLAMLMKTLIGRPYGWGNSGLYNDCSSELQSIFAAFGVWLPRHSSTQMSAGRMIDLSASTPAQRLDYLAQHGEPLRTLIYIGGHVMLYIGNTTRNGSAVPVVYQDVWGLRPADNSRRAVIGGSVILPLFEHIPEDATLQSLAATPTFQISILGAPGGGAATPSTPSTPSTPAAPPDDDNPAG